MATPSEHLCIETAIQMILRMVPKKKRGEAAALIVLVADYADRLSKEERCAAVREAREAGRAEGLADAQRRQEQSSARDRRLLNAEQPTPPTLDDEIASVYVREKPETTKH